MTSLAAPQKGLLHGLPIEVYHSNPSAVSKSGLDLIARSPAHYYAHKLAQNRPPEPKSDASQLEGSLTHCALLEPDKFDARYPVGPNVNRNTKDWKAFAESLQPSQTAIKPAQRAEAYARAAAMLRLPEIAEAVEKGRPEVSAYWVDESTGVACRCRPDLVLDVGDRGSILFDVKTFASAKPSQFRRQAARMRYHVQDSFYSEGYARASGRDVLAFVFVVVELDYPHVASALMLDEAARELGRKAWRRELDLYAECRASGKWPAYGDAVVLIDLPEWAFYEE